MFKTITRFWLSLAILFSTNLYAQEHLLPVLSGKVIDAQSGEAIVGATISVDFKKSGATTDAAGQYKISLPYGEYVLKVSSVGYNPYRTKIYMQSNLEINVELNDVTKQLEEVIVSASSNKRDIQTPSLGVTVLSLKGIKKLPTMMGEVDVIRSLQSLPGVSSVGEGANGLNIRGSNVDQNLIYIDDTPIFNPTHMFGLFSVFASDAIRDLELYKGGIPSRFGGRTASVLDIKMIEPNTDKFKMQGGIGLVSNRIMAEIPVVKEKLSVLVAGRLSANDYLFKAFAPADLKNIRANFSDIATKIYFRPNQKNTISLSAYLSHDYYRVDSLFSIENVIAKQTSFDYGHKNASFHWNHYFSPKLSMLVAGAMSNYSTKTYAPDSVNTINLNSSILYRNASLSFDYQPVENHKFNFGTSVTGYDINPGVLNDGVVSRVSSVILPKEKSIEAALYLDDEWKMNEKLTIQLGIRYTKYWRIGAGTVNEYAPGLMPSINTVVNKKEYADGEVMASFGGFEPRLTMKYSLAENTTMKLGYNRQQQFFQLLTNNTTPLPTSRWKTADSFIKPQQSDFASLGFFKTFNDNVFEVSLESYYRNVRNTLDFVSGANLQLNPNIETQLITGKSKAYGFELMLQKKKGENSGWISYTYARAFNQMVGDFPEIQSINNGNWFATNYDKPHSFNVMWNIQPSTHHSFSFTFAYNTGRPFSSPSGSYEIGGKKYAVFAERNNDRVRDYHRLDFSWTINNPSMKHKRWEGSWVFTVYNLYGRQNPYSVFFKSTKNGLKAYELSVFASPFISMTYNFKFL
ncbi:MAG: TonB-dependent receptor [Cytophagaceae bacterium]|nr:TonB-dependent receptor [Cytophagaceae bacterium]MBP6094311.1 TonB-dependent receptor [Cytophagaceae bacterium]